jgi:putative nucleotidyltransferase with HDIG domain
MPSTSDLAPAPAGDNPTVLATRSLLGDVTQHSKETGTHLHRVCAMTMKLGRALNLPKVDLDGLRCAALLHDLGKRFIHLDILHKASALDELEFSIMRSHSEIGAFVARKHGFPAEVYSAILHHHERFDGTGYPHQIMGCSIPLGARIIAVVDAVDTIMHERAYQHARPYEVAQSELVRCAGTQFDPHIAQTYSELLAGLARQLGWGDDSQNTGGMNS